MDKAGEGMVDTEDLMRKINERKIHDLKQSESQLLIAVCDTRSRGVVVISNFIDKMQELAQETEAEAKLRWFAMTVGHQGINLRLELVRFDTQQIGKINLAQFKKAIKNMPLAQSDIEI